MDTTQITEKKTVQLIANVMINIIYNVKIYMLKLFRDCFTANYIKTKMFCVNAPCKKKRSGKLFFSVLIILCHLIICYARSRLGYKNYKTPYYLSLIHI